MIFDKNQAKNLNFIYLLNDLNKMKQFENAIVQKKIDQITIEEVYLWIILYMQNVIWPL